MRIAKTKDVKTPNRGTALSAGLDFFVPNDFPETFVQPGEAAMIPSGIKVQVPANHALIAFNKSGVALRGFKVGACVIDEDYQGEVHIHLYNPTNQPLKVGPGEKATQFILLPVVYEPVEVVEETELFAEVSERGAGSFGSTGIH